MSEDRIGMGQKRIRSLIEPPSQAMKKRRANTLGAKLTADGSMEDPSYTFPLDLAAHYMVFQFYRYNFDKAAAQTMKMGATVLLPVPLNLVEQINVQYNESSLGAIGGEVSDMIARGSATEIADKADEIGKGIGGFLSSVKSAMKGKAGSLQDIANDPTAQAISLGFRTGDGAISAGLNRFFGSAPNPHITALFQGVGLRTHNFSWKLAPNSRMESDALAKIINVFRGSMLPNRGTGNLTLQFPDEVDIYIMGTEVKYMYHFKRAVVRNMATNFAPDGVLSFFGKTGAPTAVNLTLDLMETSIHTREDYEPNINFKGAQTDTGGAALKDAKLIGDVKVDAERGNFPS